MSAFPVRPGIGAPSGSRRAREPPDAAPGAPDGAGGTSHNSVGVGEAFPAQARALAADIRVSPDSSGRPVRQDRRWRAATPTMARYCPNPWPAAGRTSACRTQLPRSLEGPKRLVWNVRCGSIPPRPGLAVPRRGVKKAHRQPTRGPEDRFGSVSPVRRVGQPPAA